MQRVRMSLPYFPEFGWRPVVLAVDPAYAEEPVEPLLLETMPPDVPILRIRALPVRWTGKAGVRNLAFRALPFLYYSGARVIKRHKVDLVYFSTTLFLTMVLGRIWKKQYNIPFVLDLQDPWLSDYYEERAHMKRPPKYWLSRFLNMALEPWTMQKVDGIIAVSEGYHVTLRKRYPWIQPKLCMTIPFGASGIDYEIAAKYVGKNAYFSRHDGLVHGVYAGVLGRVMRQTCVAVCLAFQKGLSEYPGLFTKVRLHFIGTDYATNGRATKTVEPIAAEMGLGGYIQEDPTRAPYLSVLNFLKDADFLLMLGSDNPQYTASKIYPYILAQQPLLAVFHEKSSVVDVLRSTQAGDVVTFSPEDDARAIAIAVLDRWVELLRRLPYKPSTNWAAFEPYTAREMTRRQCELFDRVVSASS